MPGRLTLTNLPSRVKNPVILPSRHPMVETLVQHVHERTAHSGRGYTLAELRRRYWIVGAASLVRRVVRHCVACRRRDAQPCQQMEADLPLDRVTPYEPAFMWVWTTLVPLLSKGAGDERKVWMPFYMPHDASNTQRERLGVFNIGQHPSQQLADRTSGRSLQRTRWPRALCTGPSKRH